MNLIVASLAVALGALRLIECVYQLRKNPDLNTIQKCWQVAVNFFTIERYSK